jgi:hypothetical protein
MLVVQVVKEDGEFAFRTMFGEDTWNKKRVVVFVELGRLGAREITSRPKKKKPAKKKSKLAAN